MAKSIFLVQQVTWLWAFLDNLMSSLWQVQYFICPLAFCQDPTPFCFLATQEKVLTSSIWSDEHLCENWIIALSHWHLKELNVCTLHWVCPQPTLSFNFYLESYNSFTFIFYLILFWFLVLPYFFFLSMFCFSLIFNTPEIFIFKFCNIFHFHTFFSDLASYLSLAFLSFFYFIPSFFKCLFFSFAFFL